MMPVASMKTDSEAPWALTAVTWRSVPTGGMTAMLPKICCWCRLVVLLLLPPPSASSGIRIELAFVLELDFQLCVLGVSSPLPDGDDGEDGEFPPDPPRWSANRGEDEVKLASKDRVLTSKTCILKCCGIPPSYPSLQSISKEEVV